MDWTLAETGKVEHDNVSRGSISDRIFQVHGSAVQLDG